MTDFVNDAVSASDIYTDIPPADPDTLERRFLCQFSDVYGATGEGLFHHKKTFYPVGKYSASFTEVKFTTCPRPRYLMPGGDSEELDHCSAVASTCTEDDIKLGESATDWQSIETRDLLKSASTSYSTVNDGFVIDELLLPPDGGQQVVSYAKNRARITKWARMVGVLPANVALSFDDILDTMSNMLFGGIGLILLYRILRRGCS